MEVYNLSVRTDCGEGSMICGGICIADNDYHPRPVLQAKGVSTEETPLLAQFRQLFRTCMEEE